MSDPKIFILSVFLLISPSWTQLTPEDVAEREKWEEFLLTAKIERSETVGEGVTKPRKMFLKKGDVENTAIWKSPAGMGAGETDRWQCEIAAYRLDKLMELNMIPVTVERRYRGSVGSLQLWALIAISELKKMNENIEVPEDKLESYEKAKYIQRAWDSLIGNSDRTLQNLVYTEDWRLILIDHSKAFRDSYPFSEKLLYGKNGIRMGLLFERLPRTFVEKVKALDFKSIKEAVGKYLPSSEIRAILVRKELLLKEIDEMIKERGEADVLY